MNLKILKYYRTTTEDSKKKIKNHATVCKTYYVLLFVPNFDQ